MAPEDDLDLPQTQSQSHNTQDQVFSQDADEGKDVWGRLIAKHKSFNNFDLTSDTFTAGRATSCDYSLSAEQIKQKLLVQMSKRHFQITRNLTEVDSPVYIEDLSRNGTFVNEEKIGLNKKRILAHGDTIAIAIAKMPAFLFRDHRRQSNDLPEEIAKKYYKSTKLGSGACGTVFLVYKYRTCQKFAMKHIKKNLLVDYKTDKSLNEARIMKSLTHPCIVKMHEIVDCSDSVYITLELMKGGELLTRIQKKRYLSESNAKVFFYQMCHAIKYLHERKITHRDLKPDNILLASAEENTLLKISDFGLSKLVKNNSVLKTLCGTPLYVAPEVLLTNGKGEYTEKVDIWSLGVVLFTMLSGTLPFADDYGSPAQEQIKTGNFQFRSSNWRHVSRTAKDLIKDLLTTDVKKRPSIDQLIQTKWLRDSDMITTAHNIMGLKVPQHYQTNATRLAIHAPRTTANSGSDHGFLRPYAVDIDSENIQPSKKRRLH
ncbi:ovarian-specific serine/threonine-protein kinase Lok [Sitodiplosis mosellana]|uniref:ovarian-specific serine/threonine-protein kinase Lok n=1 Tax=Sitodiplosis mosellana TaxID=263140 RepID=UPI002444377F|nr:ovarian-specific serine/threonine-protein kinase Lok [Sitodiplosis mosellana]XP_055295027.1 ovarian-specific serine/threonine-protein kinase Lok [Sitodiplosis mosellana]